MEGNILAQGDALQYAGYIVVILYIVLFFVTLFVTLVVNLLQLYGYLFRPTPRHNNDYNIIELKEVVVVVDEHKVKEVSMNCTECAICLENLDAEEIDSQETNCGETRHSVLEQCGHKFHRGCLRSWNRYGNHTCPTCRRPNRVVDDGYYRDGDIFTGA